MTMRTKKNETEVSAKTEKRSKGPHSIVETKLRFCDRANVNYGTLIIDNKKMAV